MHELHPAATGSPRRLRAEHVEAGSSERRVIDPQIVGGHTKMMHSRPPLCNELGNRRVGRGGLEKLDPALAAWDQRYPDTF